MQLLERNRCLLCPAMSAASTDRAGSQERSRIVHRLPVQYVIQAISLCARKCLLTTCRRLSGMAHGPIAAWCGTTSFDGAVKHLRADPSPKNFTYIFLVQTRTYNASASRHFAYLHAKKGQVTEPIFNWGSYQSSVSNARSRPRTNRSDALFHGQLREARLEKTRPRRLHHSAAGWKGSVFPHPYPNMSRRSI